MSGKVLNISVEWRKIGKENLRTHYSSFHFHWRQYGIIFQILKGSKVRGFLKQIEYPIIDWQSHGAFNFEGVVSEFVHMCSSPLGLAFSTTCSKTLVMIAIPTSTPKKATYLMIPRNICKWNEEIKCWLVAVYLEYIAQERYCHRGAWYISRYLLTTNIVSWI